MKWYNNEMAIYRNIDESTMVPQPVAPSVYNIGNKPPLVNWTIVAGDSAAFRIYVEDDLTNPINVPDWTIKSEFRRYSDNIGDDLVFFVEPEQSDFDDDGEFTVKITPEQSRLLRSGDVFDVQLTDPTRVWTVCQGEVIVIGDVTDQDA
jgi:hypothetical protein